MAGRVWSSEERSAAMGMEFIEFHQSYPNRTFDAWRIMRNRMRLEESGAIPATTANHGATINFLDKKYDEDLTWEEMADAAIAMQGIQHRASSSQSHATIEILADDDPYILFLSDTHIGDWGTDYEAFKRITHEIQETPRLHVALLGDMVNMAIKLRGVAEVAWGSLLPPELQLVFFSKWLDSIAHKVVLATWDNHAVEREEAQSGISAFKNVQSKRVPYFNGIGHADIVVGDNQYNLAVSHRFRGRSQDNPVHAPMRYLLRESSDRELAAMGDYHVPGISQFTHAGRTRTALVCGSTQSNSGYAKRHYSLFTSSAMPGVSLSGDQHLITPYFTTEHWKRAVLGN